MSKFESRLAARRKVSGATMVEYAILVAVFAIGLIVAVAAMQDSVEDGFEGVRSALCSAEAVNCEGS